MDFFLSSKSEWVVFRFRIHAFNDLFKDSANELRGNSLVLVDLVLPTVYMLLLHQFLIKLCCHLINWLILSMPKRLDSCFKSWATVMLRKLVLITFQIWSHVQVKLLMIELSCILKTDWVHQLYLILLKTVLRYATNDWKLIFWEAFVCHVKLSSSNEVSYHKAIYQHGILFFLKLIWI